MKKLITLDYTNMSDAAVGARNGVSISALKALSDAVRKHHRNLIAMQKTGRLGFADLPFDPQPVRAVQQSARRRKGKYENLVVLGIGGSALGVTALQTALNSPLYNLDARIRHGRPRLFVLDNVDPDALDQVLSFVDPRKTLFNVITKSGSTSETMGQYLLVRKLLQDTLKGRFAQNIVCTTDAAKGDLRKLVAQDGYESFVIPENVGGRFSVLTPVGLFPAEMVGIPADRLMAGAAHVARECSSASLLKNPAYIFAACQYLAATKKGKNVAVLMPYAASLRDVADWFRQLWAESLGKRVDTAGRVVHTGQTPVKALGVTDQHSQMQLYVEGPADKVVTFLHVERFRSKLSFPRGPRGYSSLNYLGGKKVADLMEAEFQGTRMALTRSQRPNMTFSIRSVTPEAVGGLFQLFELANAMSGELYGINAFDQPGVEAGKEAAYALMGRKGYDELCRSIESAMKAKALRV